MTHRQLEDVRLLQLADVLALGLRTVVKFISIRCVDYFVLKIRISKSNNINRKKQSSVIDTGKQMNKKNIININLDNFSKIINKVSIMQIKYIKSLIIFLINSVLTIFF